jgi:hypothetical protein
MISQNETQDVSSLASEPLISVCRLPPPLSCFPSAPGMQKAVGSKQKAVGRGGRR